jgi:hypothetical protein
LRPFLPREGAAVTSKPRDAAVLPSCPYPGLRPFRVDEAVVFFGRDTQVDELLDRLGRKRFVAVVGTSGCGKLVAGTRRADPRAGDRAPGRRRGAVGGRHHAARRPASLAARAGAARP